LNGDSRLTLPDPRWSPVSEGYWFAAGEGRLVAQQCDRCGTHRWPPAWACYVCQSLEWSWNELPGTGTVFSYTWANHRPAEIELYNVSVIEVDGTRGDPVRLMTRVVEVDEATLRCGLPVHVIFQAFDDQIAIPFFRPQ